MDYGKWALIIGIAVAVVIVAAVMIRRSRKPKEMPRTPEQMVIDTWTALLQTDAKVYTGLFGSMQRVAKQTSKKPEKVLKEWSNRTGYQWEGSEAARLCVELLNPAIERADAAECAKWAKLLLDAAGAAGITASKKGTILLDDLTVTAYTEWDQAEIYPGDQVNVYSPAWLQNGQVLERGQCSVIQK